MKKILLGVLIVAALSACSSSEEKTDIPTQIQTLNETVEMNANTLTEIKSGNEEVRSELEMSHIMMEQMKMIKAFEGTGVTVIKVNNGLFLTLPRNTTFESSKAVLNENMKTILDPIAETLMTYPAIDAVIKGHTDNSGTEEFNQKLSEDRAMAVSTYLMDMGIDSSRIRTVGVGSSQPIDDNDTADGKMANRRIDITISY